MKRKSLESIRFSPFQPSAAFHMEAGHLLCNLLVGKCQLYLIVTAIIVIVITFYLLFSSERPKWTKSFPEVIDLTLEKDLNLLCNATGNPQPTFEWFQNSRALKT